MPWPPPPPTAASCGMVRAAHSVYPGPPPAPAARAGAPLCARTRACRGRVRGRPGPAAALPFCASPCGGRRPAYGPLRSSFIPWVPSQAAAPRAAAGLGTQAGRGSPRPRARAASGGARRQAGAPAANGSVITCIRAPSDFRRVPGRFVHSAAAAPPGPWRSERGACQHPPKRRGDLFTHVLRLPLCLHRCQHFRPRSFVINSACVKGPGAAARRREARRGACRSRPHRGCGRGRPCPWGGGSWACDRPGPGQSCVLAPGQRAGAHTPAGARIGLQIQDGINLQ